MDENENKPDTNARRAAWLEYVAWICAAAAMSPVFYWLGAAVVDSQQLRDSFIILVVAGIVIAMSHEIRPHRPHFSADSLTALCAAYAAFFGAQILGDRLGIIPTLLLTFFFRYMRPLIEQGYVYSAVPPLYKLTRGKTSRVAYSDEERDRISAEMRGGNSNVTINISRFKGLGEMDAHELWETTMDPNTRTLRRITLDDAVKADATFTVLMGEKVEPRKEFIEQRAKYAVNLDY